MSFAHEQHVRLHCTSSLKPCTLNRAMPNSRRQCHARARCCCRSCGRFRSGFHDTRWPSAAAIPGSHRKLLNQDLGTRARLLSARHAPLPTLHGHSCRTSSYRCRHTCGTRCRAICSQRRSCRTTGRCSCRRSYRAARAAQVWRPLATLDSGSSLARAAVQLLCQAWNQGMLRVSTASFAIPPCTASLQADAGVIVD